MTQKKDRSRFSIKFNERDPSHESVIRLLEQQPPHSKAQFIVNAILHYVHCPETPDIMQGQVTGPVSAVDRVFIEKMVSEILLQKDIERMSSEKNEEQKGYKKTETIQAKEEMEGMEEQKKQDALNNTVRAMIASTMSAFRNE